MNHRNLSNPGALLNPLPASFRDPSGFLFRRGGILYRYIHPRYKPHYDYAVGSGLYQALMDESLLIRHAECEMRDIAGMETEPYKILKPEIIPFISYPYEWSFEQLKQAALTTLNVQKKALERGMSLKDASAFNIQFFGALPIFIDTLSFEVYEEWKPWVAYRQFCRHFLAPLALMASCDLQFGKAMMAYFDGFPLDLVSRTLPFGTKFGPLLLHLHLLAISENWKVSMASSKLAKLSKVGFFRLLDSLEMTVRCLKPKRQKTYWGNYAEGESYSGAALKSKQAAVSRILAESRPQIVWDIGANTGAFSAVAFESGSQFVLALDSDPLAVNQHYEKLISQNNRNIHPLVMDFAHPTPSLGWGHEERLSLEDRGPCDMILALAVLHHWVISNNLPLEKVARCLSNLCENIMIEFVPKNDPQALSLLANREDIFDDYSQEGFEKAFSRHFQLVRRSQIDGSLRWLYYLKKLS